MTIVFDSALATTVIPSWHEWNSHLEIFIHLHTIENSRQHLLLRTDILQKTVLGCPWLLNQWQMHKGTGPSYLLQRLLEHASPLLAIVFSFSPEVWLVSYLFFLFQIWYMHKWMFTSIGQRKHVRVTSFNISRVSAWRQALPSMGVAALHLCICTWLVQSDPEHMHWLDPEHWH